MSETPGESPFTYTPSGLTEYLPENPIRIIVTGWRAWPLSHRQIIWNELDGLWDRFAIPWERNRFIIVHGQCPYGGADLHADGWAQVQRQRWERHPAESRGGRFLGPERNAKMVNLGAALCLAFPGPGSRGTIDCVKKARAAGIAVKETTWSLL